ncbi:MAG: bacillithiol system redox-active protein YtxJ [Chitinophagales bacterium]|nr:bacillithiol system redox-active protein YtxJ [Bacteroidota bacterium]MCB9042426.1 bacillithiol system redox-active protein YtxJ [Chitinophagales bacterium]
MGIFDKLNVPKEKELTPDIWIPLEDENLLESLFSQPQTFAIFKHSTRCSISLMAKKRLEREWANSFSQENLPLYYLDLLTYRPISNAVAQLSSVEHQSPQLIVIYQGKLLYATSHNDISAADAANAFMAAITK